MSIFDYLNNMRKFIITLLITGGVMFGLYAGGSGEKEIPTLGITDGKFVPCPESPNCVSTMAPEDDKEHYIAPLEYSGSRLMAYQHMLQALDVYGKETVTIIQKDPETGYIRTEFRTKFFKFTDDVEIWLPEDDKIIHVRSASRVGYGDMGANRKRVEHLYKLFTRQ